VIVNVRAAVGAVGGVAADAAAVDLTIRIADSTQEVMTLVAAVMSSITTNRTRRTEQNQ
jgi:hypothetical protein